ncbi:MAG: hypothetical protein ACR2KZ_21680, partial [Segetibacter sp.]
MKKSILSLAIALVALVSFSTASAQQNPKPGVHENAQTTFYTDPNDQSLVVCYNISGLGNISSVDVTITYDVTVTTFCTTRGKGHPDA